MIKDKLRSWGKTFSVYLQWPMLQVLLLGISSGFPLLLTGATLSARLTESGIKIEDIGLFALVGLPYTFKFLAAPVIDALHLPKMRSHLAHRKSWCVLLQLLLTASLFGMASCNPDTQILKLAVFALMTSTFSAMQDIVIDALRVEMLPKDAQGAAAAAWVAGYRIGMLMAGAGALVLATHLPWDIVYRIGAGIMASCIFITLTIRRLRGIEEAVADGRLSAGEIADIYEEDSNSRRSVEEISDKSFDYKNWIYTAVIAPIADFVKRPAAAVILAFISLFKLGDAMAGSLSVTFYLNMGFTKIEIAAVTKVIGVIAVIAGTAVGGLVVKRFMMMRALVICGILQILSNFVFVWLSYVGHSNIALTACIIVENVSGGMGTAAFVAFMAQLCNIRFTATQYALLTSLSSIGRTLFASSAGYMEAAMGWAGFFTATAVMGVPGMLLLYLLYLGGAMESKPDMPESEDGESAVQRERGDAGCPRRGGSGVSAPPKAAPGETSPDSSKNNKFIGNSNE